MSNEGNTMNARQIGGALAAIVGLALLVPGTAGATGGYPAVVHGHSPALHPEGVAYDPTRHTFLVGSLFHGTVSVVAPDGSTRTLVDDPRIVGTVGLHVDAARGRILVTYGDIGISEGAEPDPAKRRTGLGIFDLRTGAARHVVDLAVGPGHTANDVTFDRDGNAYVTDSESDVIYKVDPVGHASEFLRDPRFAKTPTGAAGINGIAWHPDGYLLVGKYDTGQLFRIPTRGRPVATEVRLDHPLVGADGIALHRNGDLVVVTNNLGGAPEAVDALTILRPRNDWHAARELSRDLWPVDDPTTVADAPFGDYAVSGNLAILLGGLGTSDEFTLRRR
jgi:sugar lactone lactonase YvrE